MGGIIRPASTGRLFANGVEAEKLFIGGSPKWARPVKSSMPTMALEPNENILFFGSSVLGCAVAATWSQQRHNFYNVFRNATIGNTSSMQNVFEQLTLYGAGAGISFANIDLLYVVNNAKNGQYTGANPFDSSINSYDCAVIEVRAADASLLNPNSWQFEYSTDAFRYNQNPTPYDLFSTYFREIYIRSTEALMDTIRHIRAAGIDKIYLSCNMPSLYENGSWAGNEDPENYGKAFIGMNKYYNYLQDKLNHQIDIEGLGGHVSMLPFHKVWERLYNDFYVDQTSPVEFTDYRRLWSTASNGDGPEVAVTSSNDRHYYMKSYWGGYILSALIAAIVYDIDPRTLPNTDGTLTLPTNLADYFNDVVYDIKTTFPRAGRVSGDVGYRMPRLNQGSLESILGNKLIYMRDGPVNADVSVSIDPSQIGQVIITGYQVPIADRVTSVAEPKIILTNGQNSQRYEAQIEFRETEHSRMGHHFLYYPGYPHNMGASESPGNFAAIDGGSFYIQFKIFNGVIESEDFLVDNYILVSHLDEDLFDMWASRSYFVSTNAAETGKVSTLIEHTNILIKPIENFIFHKIVFTAPLTYKEVEEVKRFMAKDIGTGSVDEPNSFL